MDCQFVMVRFKCKLVKQIVDLQITKGLNYFLIYNKTFPNENYYFLAIFSKRNYIYGFYIIKYPVETGIHHLLASQTFIINQ